MPGLIAPNDVSLALYLSAVPRCIAGLHRAVTPTKRDEFRINMDTEGEQFVGDNETFEEIDQQVRKAQSPLSRITTLWFRARAYHSWPSACPENLIQILSWEIGPSKIFPSHTVNLRFTRCVDHYPAQYDREEREKPFIPPPVEEPPPVEGDGAGIVDTRPVEEQLAEARKKVREVSMHNGP